MRLSNSLYQTCNSVDSSFWCTNRYSTHQHHNHHTFNPQPQQQQPVSAYVSQYLISNGNSAAFTTPASLRDLIAVSPDVIGRGHPGEVGATLGVKQEHLNLTLDSSPAVPRSGCAQQPMTVLRCQSHLSLANGSSAVPPTWPQVQLPVRADRPFAAAILEPAPTLIAGGPSDTALYCKGHWTPGESVPADLEPSTAAMPGPNPSQSVRSEFVRRLVDIAATIVENIWPKTHSSHPHSTPNLLPLRPFIESLVRRSRTSFSTLQLALFYLLRLCTTQRSSPSAPSPTPSTLCGRRMFLASLVVASKYLQDRNFSNKAWAKICELEVAEVNAAEREFLGAVGYRVHVEYKTFVAWSAMLLQRCGGGEGVKAMPMNSGVEVRVAGLENGVLPTPRTSPDGKAVVDVEAMKREDGQVVRKDVPIGGITTGTHASIMNSGNVTAAAATTVTTTTTTTTTTSNVVYQTAKVVNRSRQVNADQLMKVEPVTRVESIRVTSVDGMLDPVHRSKRCSEAKRSDRKRVRSLSRDSLIRDAYPVKLPFIESR
ncbi:hypothetical protein BJ742DRAFT_714880 [Cladochytrium replicatum]|nr:hypothetical protein BJ742DRAFT_714880 [Cladochytrium replicatum]